MNIVLSEDLVRYALNMLGDHAKAISTEEELNKFTVSDPEYMFVGKFQAAQIWIFSSSRLYI